MPGRIHPAPPPGPAAPALVQLGPRSPGPAGERGRGGACSRGRQRRQLTQVTKHMKPASSNQAEELPVKPLRVALVEDQREIRENWQRLIESFPDFKCVCTCATAEEALRVLAPARPDVVLMDIYLPRMSGIECTARLKALLPETQIVILTAVDDDELVFLALEAGGDGYLLKRTKPDDLRTALLDRKSTRLNSSHAN